MEDDKNEAFDGNSACLNIKFTQTKNLQTARLKIMNTLVNIAKASLSNWKKF